MINGAIAGMLVKEDHGKHVVMAQWPKSLSSNAAIVGSAVTGLSKKRLHLEKQGEGMISLVSPVVNDDGFWGVAVFLVRKHGVKDMEAVVKILDWGMTWLRFLLYQHRLAASDAHPLKADATLAYLAAILKDESTTETATTVVNQFASKYGLHRVCLGTVKNNKLSLTAVSFSAGFDKRSEPMQNIIDAMNEAFSKRRNIFVSRSNAAGDLNVYPSQCHKQLLENNNLDCVDSLLIRSSQGLVGVLTAEQKGKKLLPEERESIEAYLNLTSSVFTWKAKAEMGVVDNLRKAFARILKNIFRTDEPFNKMLVTVAFMGGVALFFPVNHSVTSSASLVSHNKHLLISPHDGFISSVNVKPGDTVKNKQVLVTLSDEELKLERRVVSSRLEQYRLEYDNALASGDRAQAAILKAKVNQGTAELNLIEQKLKRTYLISPIDGIVVSEDIRHSVNAPVSRGDLLLEIADSDKYFIELSVNEADIADISLQQKGLLSLASLPGEKFEMAVSRITPISELDGGRNYFRVEASLDKYSQQLRPGMTGKGEVYIEKRMLGRILFHELWRWFRLNLW